MGQRRYKIGIFLDGPYQGGVFQYALTVVNALAALDRDRFSVVALTPSKDWLPYIPAGLETRVVSLGLRGRAFEKYSRKLNFSPATWRRVGAWLHPFSRAAVRERCDLWIFPAHDDRSYQWPVSALIAIHDIMHRYENFPELVANGIAEARDRGFVAMRDWGRGFMTDSELGRQQWCDSYGTDPKRVHVLPFIAPGYIFATGAPAGFDGRYKLPKKYIFYPAQFWEHKNHRNLLLALHALLPRYPDLKLVLAGSKKNCFEAVESLIGELGLADAVTILGYVPNEDLPELYRRARALVMPTYLGPTNIPPLEAFAVGCPVAISGAYAMPEQAGGAALHFDPRSVEELAAAIEKLWTDDRLCGELAEKGRRRTASWGQPQFNQRLREIILKVLGEGPK